MEQSLEIFLNGVKFRKLLEKVYTDVRKAYGLCKIDVQILQYLEDAGEYNTSKHIVDIGLFTKGHVSQSLNRLHKKELIDMVHDEQDRRCIHISLRDEAKDIVREVSRVRQKIQEIVFEDFTEEETNTLFILANKINMNIQKASASLEE